jgi:hypothetical protein
MHFRVYTERRGEHTHLRVCIARAGKGSFIVSNEEFEAFQKMIGLERGLTHFDEVLRRYGITVEFLSEGD